MEYQILDIIKQFHNLIIDIKAFEIEHPCLIIPTTEIINILVNTQRKYKEKLLHSAIFTDMNTLPETPKTPETPETPETPASNDEYDELLAAEEGRAGPNSNVGGTRKRRRGGKKWGGKKRKTHRRH